MNIRRYLGKVYYDSHVILFKLMNRHGLFYRIGLETISQCNRKCNYCPNSKYDRGRHLMPMRTFKKIINELKELKWNGIIYPWYYGEPLLDKRLPELVKIIKENLPKRFC